MSGPPPAPTIMPICPKCGKSAAVVYIGESRAFIGKGKPPVKVYGCRSCAEDFVPRTPNDHPALISDGVPPVRSGTP